MHDSPATYIFLDPNDVWTRYDISFKEAAALRLQPVRAASCKHNTAATGRDVEATQQQYLRYVLNIARRNEAMARHAQRWWRWWEAMQATEKSPMLEPLVPSTIAQTLRFQARLRQQSHSKPVASSTSGRAARNKEPRQRTETLRAADLDDLACAAVDMFEDRDSPDFNPHWTKKDIARHLKRPPSCLSITRPDGKPRLPKLEARVQKRNARQEHERQGRRARYGNK